MLIFEQFWACQLFWLLFSKNRDFFNSSGHTALAPQVPTTILIMTLLITTLFIMRILITLNMGDIICNDNTYNWFYLQMTILTTVNKKTFI
jgi:hypothetical protein